ncbi:hypothetical protein P7C73_g574, partial [Tremellales sp. Uapishka_1]
MLISHLLLLLSPVIAAAAKPKVVPCIESGDETRINALFEEGGKGTLVALCPGSVHRLQAPIIFTAPQQTLTTEGNVKGRERAMLIVEGAEQATAIRADCAKCSYSTIRSLVVDGNRPQMLRLNHAEALLALGNAEGQTVRDCRLYEPRGWSALHVREGDRKQCSKAHIVDNEIVLFDTTDGAIVLFGSSGTEVRNNEIFSRTRMVSGGINLVDYEPFDGDYSFVRVHHNTIYAHSRYLKVGIAVGPSTWEDDITSVVHGGSITDNTLHGNHFGYGFVVSSAKGFTVLRNVVDENARFSGSEGPRCPQAPKNHRPTPFLIHRASSQGSFQEDFVNGEVEHIICLNPPDENGKPYRPWRYRDSPLSIATKEAALIKEHPEMTKIADSNFDGRLAEALVDYQTALISAMEDIALPTSNDATLDEDRIHKESGDPRIKKLTAKLETLEKGDKDLWRQFDAISFELGTFITRTNDSTGLQKSSLQTIWNFVDKLKASPRDLAQRDVPGDQVGGGLEEEEASSITLTAILTLLGALVVVAFGLVVIKRWRSRTTTRKGSKMF